MEVVDLVFDCHDAASGMRCSWVKPMTPDGAAFLIEERHHPPEGGASGAGIHWRGGAPARACQTRATGPGHRPDNLVSHGP